MTTRTFTVTRTTPAPPERVFALLADGARWAEWGGRFVPASRWEREGTPPPGGVGAVRALGTGSMVTHEEVVESDPPRRHAYRILSGLPVRDYLATVDLTPEPGGGTKIVWHAEFAGRYPGTAVLVALLSRVVVGSLASNLASAAAAEH